MRSFVPVWFTVLAVAPLGSAQSAPDQIFLDTVKPALKQHCFGCHGEGDAFAKLDLTTREGALRGGTRGSSIIPGDPDASLLVAAVEHTVEVQMPPGGLDKKLPPETIAAIRRWIAGGAPYAVGEAVRTWDYAEEDIWAFRAVRSVTPPEPVLGVAEAATPVDNFILARLSDAGLTPAPEADKRTLLRRVSYDLTGLPPTPEEVDAFLSDDSPGAYKRVVERLLDSPEYGERWGRRWLDITRYADSGGYSNDFERPNAWRYRDYVIRSFNADKPYDRFVLEQIAGDELFPNDAEAILATGFLRAGPWEHTGMSVAAVTRQLFLDDVTHAVGTTFLGLTLGCARCHDHKFDPIPTKDYYSVQAAFATTAFARRPLGFLADENTEGFESGRKRFSEMIGQIERRVEELHEDARRKLAVEQGAEAAQVASTGVLQRRLKGEEAETLKLLRKHLALYGESQQRYEPMAFTVTSGLQDSWNDVGPNGANSFLTAEDYRTAETYVLTGGDVQAAAERVEPGVLTAVERYSEYAAPNIPSSVEGRRAALARWIADAENPLTARVMVNRIWQGHFGRGLAENSNNFGKMGRKPSHPELLDWLATFFVEHDWSVKAVHRVILYSYAYRRSTRHPELERVRAKDPGNRLLARFSPRRLEAEELRDSMLAVAGQLSRSRGGPGTYPQINADVARQPQHAMGTLRPAYRPSPTKSKRNRRSIYSFQQRSLIDPMIETFNGANVDLSCERRESSTVPTQAFSLLNSEVSHETALEMAARIEREASTTEERINRAFALAYGRKPTERERALALDHVAVMTSHHAAHPAEPRRAEPPIVHEITSELTGEQYKFIQPDEVFDYQHNLHASQARPETRALADVALALLNSNEFVYVY